MLRTFTRGFKNSAKQIAFVFDIDGVLIRGGQAIPQAKPALELLKSENVPFMLLTNGGGTLEKQRTEYLSRKLDTYLNPIQIVQSHTPFKTLVHKYNKVLIVGGPEDKARFAAQNYGFQNVVLPVDVLASNPAVWPFHKYTDQQIQEWAVKDQDVFQTKFDAIFVFNDPRDMGSDLQIILDLLNSENGVLGTRRRVHSSKPAIPIYFSNNDFLWANEYKLPRFGQGAFRMMVEHVYKETNAGQDLESTIIGKPNPLTYKYVHNALIDWDQKLKLDPGLCHSGSESLVQVVPELGQDPESDPFSDVYMVGDNLASDIEGAVAYGWKSCLVKTGVYQPGDELYVKPTHIVNNVYEAVLAGLKQLK